MSFDPAQFYCVATALTRTARPNNAALRTAIGRAYYAALIVARDAREVPHCPGNSSHQDVVDAYTKSAAGGDGVVARKLRAARHLRNQADYHPEHYLEQRDMLAAMSTSRQVLQQLRKMPKCGSIP